MLKIMIVDDESWALEEMTAILGGHSMIVGTFIDAVEAIDAVDRLEPDVVFLDIEMPEMNGFKAAEEILIRRPQTGLVLATAYSQYAAKAFDLEVIDYLLKPFNAVRVLQSLQRAEKRSGTEKCYQSLSLSLTTHRQLEKMEQSQIWLSQNGLLTRVTVASIDACFIGKTDRHTTVIAGGKAYNSIQGLQEFVILCGQSKLQRCHRSCYVNPARIQSFHLGNDRTLWIHLADWPEELPVSRQYRQEILGRLALKKSAG